MVDVLAQVQTGTPEVPLYLPRVLLLALTVGVVVGVIRKVPSVSGRVGVLIAGGLIGFWAWTADLSALMLRVQLLIPSLLMGGVILILGWYVSELARHSLQGTGSRLGWETALTEYLGRTLKVVVLVVFAIMALNTAGFPVASLLATLGISGIIIGLGLRGQIANYFAGVMMLAARPFKQGDLIEFGPPPQVGHVQEVCMTFTALDTLDNVRIVVPNAVLWRNRIFNFSVHDQRAIRITMSIPYETDVGWVKDIALDVLKRHDAVLNTPAPSFTTSDVTATDVKALVVAWSHVSSMNVFGSVLTEMREEFATAGLAVTVPSKDIDLKREE